MKKRFTAVFLALALCLGLCVPAFAAGKTTYHLNFSQITTAERSEVSITGEGLEQTGEIFAEYGLGAGQDEAPRDYYPVFTSSKPILSKHFYRSLQEPLPYKSIEGIDNIDKVVTVDQSPLGRSPRSNPATYTGVFTDIRNLFVNLPEAKIRGYKPGRFSFNISGGRCEACNGNGYKTIEMNFLPDVLIPCEECHGKRYNRETLEVRFKGKSIADVLDMTINQAFEFFQGIPAIYKKIKVLQDIGLGYIKLGQPSSTLSGGENQRVKLATELAKRDTGKTLFILDEPTTGLHFDDIRTLLGILNKLVERGNTVLVIEHNLDMVRMADFLIDMGPDGGAGGGKIIAQGTPEEVAATDSPTARFLRDEGIVPQN